MTPSELIALSRCSRPEGGRACKVCTAVAADHVEAVEAAGLVVVSAEDLDIVMNRGDEAVGWPTYSATCDRLRAALPERTETDG